jgi:hypothetical protein
MRILILAAAIVFSAATAQAQQNFTLGQPLTAAWLSADNEAAAAVTTYPARLNGVDLPAIAQPIPSAEYRYSLPQALLTVGDHVFSVRACAGTACGPELSTSFTIGRPLPGAPRNPRIIPTPELAVLTIPQAIDRANAYSLLILDRPLTQGELNTLSMRHGNVPPTRQSVFGVLDASFADFVIR